MHKVMGGTLSSLSLAWLKKLESSDVVEREEFEVCEALYRSSLIRSRFSVSSWAFPSSP